MVQDIIKAFIEKNPRKRFPDKTWKVCNPEKYQAAILLYNDGYSIADIARHVGCTYDTLRKTFARDEVFRPKKYKQKHKIITQK
jgi:AraC-like DNA-binding protein